MKKLPLGSFFYAPMIYLAPLQGFTDLTFRNVYFRHFDSIDAVVAPFISLMPAEKISEKRVKDIIPEKNFQKSIIPQILGNDVGDFILLVTYLFDRYGYQEINWNLGCPIPSITKKKRGAGLLCFPELIEKLLEKIIPKIPQKLSVKLRLGLNSADEFEKIIPVLNSFPLANLIIHPRIATQMYEGTILLEELKSYLPGIKHKVVYNGEITTVQDYNKIKGLLPEINDIMIGRGVFSNPFLPEQIKNSNTPLLVDAPNRFRKFYFDLERAEKLEKKRWMNKMKEYWKYFARFLNLDDTELHHILKITSEQEWQRQIEEIANK